jgi:hypothetical protein
MWRSFKKIYATVAEMGMDEDRIVMDYPLIDEAYSEESGIHGAGLALLRADVAGGDLPTSVVCGAPRDSSRLLPLRAASLRFATGGNRGFDLDLL